MQRYTNFIASTTATNSTLTVLSNASCVVYIAGTLGAATLYSDNGVTPLANPFLSSATGRIDFYAANRRRCCCQLSRRNRNAFANFAIRG